MFVRTFEPPSSGIRTATEGATMIIGVIVSIAIVVAVAVIGAVALNRRRMRASFGAEYEELVQQEGGRRAADREIMRRRRAHAKLDLRTLKDEDVARFAA